MCASSTSRTISSCCRDGRAADCKSPGVGLQRLPLLPDGRTFEATSTEHPAVERVTGCQVMPSPCPRASGWSTPGSSEIRETTPGRGCAPELTETRDGPKRCPLTPRRWSNWWPEVSVYLPPDVCVFAHPLVQPFVVDRVLYCPGGGLCCLSREIKSHGRRVTCRCQIKRRYRRFRVGRRTLQRSRPVPVAQLHTD